MANNFLNLPCHLDRERVGFLSDSLSVMNLFKRHRNYRIKSGKDVE